MNSFNVKEYRKKTEEKDNSLTKFRGKKNRNRKKFSIARNFNYYKYRLLRLRENPQKIARGFASGIFAGCLPLMGLQFIISVIIAFLVRGNKFAAVMGTWISNPITYIPLFVLNFQLGKFILSFFLNNNTQELNLKSWANLKGLGTDITITLLFGSVIMGLFASIFGYYLILYLLSKKQNK